MFGSKKTTWEEMLSSYINNPRDVKTIPLKKEGVWFYVYVENNDIYVESARNHLANSSSIKNRRKIEKEKVDIMLSLYNRRKKGEKVADEAKRNTQNQVYWYGIFADMCI